MEILRYDGNDIDKIKSKGEILQLIGETGSFVLKDCLDNKLTDKVHISLKKLFSVPIDVKMKYFIDKNTDPLGAGFSPYGVAKAIDTGLPNLLETWDINSDRHGWPIELENEWNIIRAYQVQLAKIAFKSLSLLADLLKTDTRQLTNLVDEHSIEGIHLIHYFPVTLEHNINAKRQSIHCDNTLITLIPPPYPLKSGILSLNRKTKQWEKVTENKSDCFIQAGLVLERITGGKIKANIHTVTDPRDDPDENTHRYSTPFFYSPKRGSVIRILDGFPNDTITPPITVEELEKQYFKNIFNNERISRTKSK